MKNVKKVVLAASLCAAMAATAAFGTLAYFNDTDEATNVFTAGDLGIELTEADWNAEAAHQIVPGASFDKTPVITLDADSVASYVRVVVTMPDAIYNYSDFNGNTGTYIDFVSTVTGGEVSSKDGVTTVTFDYTQDATTAETTVATLFTDVSFSSALDNNETAGADYTAWKAISDSLSDGELNIGIKVYAVQQVDGMDADTLFAAEFSEFAE